MPQVSFFCDICNEVPGCCKAGDVLICNWCSVTDCVAIVPAQSAAIVPM